MARVRFDEREIDQCFQIEDGILETLRHSPVASISKFVIESNYEIESDELAEKPVSLEEKCKHLSSRLGVRIEISDALIIFRRRRTKMPRTVCQLN